MIEPQRAPVRPRVICPESGEELLLEEVVRSFLEAGRNCVLHLQADPDSSAMALCHLAFIYAWTPKVSLQESPVPSVVVRCKPGNQVLVNYRLAPWGRDDWIEYLLTKHRDRCASVMGRLLRRNEPRPGSPFLWSVILDQMAADESLRSPRQAALRYVASLVDDAASLPKVQAACLDALASHPKEEAKLAQALTWAGCPKLNRLLGSHPALRLLLAADKIAADLAAQADCAYLGRPLPRELVRETARLVAPLPEAMAQLNRLVVSKRWAMAASLLHATDCGWVPDRERLPVLCGAYLGGAAWPDASLVGLDAWGADLVGADLRRADLSGAKLVSANLSRACLQRALLVGADASRASLGRADLSFVQATEAKFWGADLRGADLDGALLAEAFLESAQLDGACLTDADLRRADLVGAKLGGADLSGANLTGARLARVKLKESRCVGAVFAQADLTCCDLEGMELPAADFTGADLTYALLTGTAMADGRLDGARLRSAGLAEVDWQRASLRGADLTGASFHLGSSRSGRVGSPIACEGSKTGFYTDDYDEQDFKSPEEIRKANLCFADLRGAILEKVDFYLVDLRGALLDPEQEEHARRCGAILEARA
ncbi:MAG TPA: pentapeptide repeat-containing protein [Gemmataceae bacterium]|nr:pentapeptide repeat-containing protein [Gemmataceae bacterium]